MPNPIREQLSPPPNCGRLCDLLDDKAVDTNKELNRI